MSIRKLPYLLTASFVVVVLFASPASACKCDVEGTPCQALGSADAVFVGKVVGAKEQLKIKNADGSITPYDVGEIYFQIEEAFAGVKGPRVVIHSGAGGGDCGKWFLRGKRYLVYAFRDSQGNLGTGICTRTRLLTEAAEDLNFLRNLPRKGTGGRIYGTVVAAQLDAKGQPSSTTLSGVTVKIEGERKTLDAITDTEGRYELTGLSAGKYKVYAEVPEYYHRDDYWISEVELHDRGCAEIGFFAHNNSRITGQVLGPDGTVLADAMVEVIPVESLGKPVNGFGHELGLTNKKGEYELEQIAPGRYFLGINLTTSPDKEAPYPRTFYPGVTDPTRATVVEVRLGEKLSDINFQLAASLAERVVRGFVIWPDGTLAAGVDVHLEDVDFPGSCIDDCSAQTDSQGRFELKAYDGCEYKVVSLADKSEKHKDDTYGFSSSFRVSTDLDGIKVVLSMTGHPSDRKEEKTSEKPD